jgi:2-dehydro-3-deoxyphosphogluconate aldolase/(4S)-4-hydroxy-2-oxoglutarate aldolase
MAKRDILNTILDVGIIPIVRTDNSAHALHAIEAIYSAGIPILEVTMTVPGALKTLEAACDRFGDGLVLGAGTVLDATTARNCMLAGAEFCVTPSLDAYTIEICNRYSKCVIPGALTPTEIMTAWNAGATLVKVFPVGALGGAKYIKALKAPLPQVLLVPTGGVNLENAPEFFRAGASAVAVGSDLVNQRWLAQGEFGRIKTAARDFLDKVAEARAA